MLSQCMLWSILHLDLGQTCVYQDKTEVGPGQCILRSQLHSLSIEHLTPAIALYRKRERRGGRGERKGRGEREGRGGREGERGKRGEGREGRGGGERGEVGEGGEGGDRGGRGRVKLLILLHQHALFTHSQ